MARRNSPNDISDLGELSQLSDFVFDKRHGQRASAKRHRRNRHYEKQFIRNSLAHLPRVEQAGADGQPLPLPPDDRLRQEDGS
jgi:hypothetical protein